MAESLSPGSVLLEMSQVLHDKAKTLSKKDSSASEDETQGQPLAEQGSGEEQPIVVHACLSYVRPLQYISSQASHQEHEGGRSLSLLII